MERSLDACRYVCLALTLQVASETSVGAER